MLMEEPMKSLSELADIYERWANANEATAEEILARLDSLPGNVQQQQRWRASQVKAEAAALKKRAAELRDLDGGKVFHPAPEIKNVRFSTESTRKRR
jgi:hypothetical protein